MAAVLVLLVIPVPATARPGYFKVPGQRYADVRVHGTHGYGLQISAMKSGVFIVATKGDSSVSYLARRGKLEGDHIKAHLPGVGWVFLRFRELKRYHRKPADNCRGPDPLVRSGIFVGWIRINGERNYTRVNAHHVLGKITRQQGTVCTRRADARASKTLAEQLLSAETRRGRGTLSFFAYNLFGPSEFNLLIFRASLFRTRGQMVISNASTAISQDPGTMAVAEPPRSATVDPPSPFTGTAAFRQEVADEFSWLGDLQVELPGIGDVALAGPRFDASLCVGRRCRGDSEEGNGGTFFATIVRAAAPTPIPWPKPGSLR
jgi:hypothetical protein